MSRTTFPPHAVLGTMLSIGLPLSLPLALLLGLLLGCAGPSAQQPAPASAQASSAGAGAQQTPGAAPVPDWRRPAALSDFWPQAAPLAQTGDPCPFQHQRRDDGTASLLAEYQTTHVRRGAYALHLRYSGVPGTSAGWGVGCLRYNTGLFSYVRFWLKGSVGERFQFRLKDSAGQEGTAVDLKVAQEGWHRIIIPLRDFRGVNVQSIASVTFSFRADQGAADVYLDDLEFVTHPESD